MPRKQRRISYIKKPFSRKSFSSLGFMAVGVLAFLVSLGLSVHNQGNGEVDIAAWGITSILFSLIAVWYGASSFLEKEMNYILSKISMTVSGILLVFWFCMILVGLIG